MRKQNSTCAWRSSELWRRHLLRKNSRKMKVPQKRKRRMRKRKRRARCQNQPHQKHPKLQDLRQKRAQMKRKSQIHKCQRELKVLRARESNLEKIWVNMSSVISSVCFTIDIFAWHYTSPIARKFFFSSMQAAKNLDQATHQPDLIKSFNDCLLHSTETLLRLWMCKLICDCTLHIIEGRFSFKMGLIWVSIFMAVFHQFGFSLSEVDFWMSSDFFIRMHFLHSAEKFIWNMYWNDWRKKSLRTQ